MTDRVPTKVLGNGAVRYGVYDEDGNLLRYEYIKAEDDPSEIGTPLRKETLLKDATARAIGLTQEDPTVDDALAGLAGRESGVSSFKGRKGAVVPQSGDYTAAQVGALPNQTVPLSKGGTGYSASSLADLKSHLGIGNSEVGKSLAGKQVSPDRDTTVTAKDGAEIFNDYQGRTYDAEFGASSPVSGNVSSGFYSHAEGHATTAEGSYSHAEGCQTKASGECAHAEGRQTNATGSESHAEGFSCTASGRFAHAEGSSCTASDYDSHAEGSGCVASGFCSHAEGIRCTASGGESHAGGSDTVAKGGVSFCHGRNLIANHDQAVFGSYNVEKTVPQGLLQSSIILGDGTATGYEKNTFRATTDGVYSSGNYHSSGADYAELFQWMDNNPNAEDRVGLFVTLDGSKIRLAGPMDTFILGIVSGSPSVVGDVYDDQWKGMYLTDVFGRPILEDVEVPDETVDVPDPDHPEKTVKKVVRSAHTGRRQKVNPEYDHTQKYIPRSERPEWDAVGILGKLVAVDDGTCEVNGWATVGPGGIATASSKETRYRVMERLDRDGKHYIRILIL